MAPVRVLLVVALVAGLVAADMHEDLIRDGYELKNELFHLTYTKGLHKVMVAHRGFTNWQWLHKTAESASVGIGGVGYWNFIPAQIPVRLLPDQEATWRGPCFGQLTATLTANSTGGTITIKADDKKNPVCTEFYDFGDRENAYISTIAFRGTHHITIKGWLPNEYEDVMANGMNVFLFPMNEAEVAASVLMTLELFDGNNPKMADDNVKFIGEKMQWLMPTRDPGIVQLAESDLQAGDYLAILRLDGLDPLIMWGTGGHTGHTAILIEFDDGLYVCESTDTMQANSSFTYWPPPYGIIRTPYQQWIKQAQAADFMVAVLRLSPEYQKQWDNDKAVAFFKQVEGMPYGWHNFIYTFLDTEYNNLPRPVTPDLMEQVIGMAEPRIPFDSKASIYSMVIQGLNHRLGTSCTTMNCVYNFIDPLGESLFNVASMPEQDAWTYPGNGCPYDQCRSMVCDVFVMEVYQNAGLQLPVFQATEQTPKDTYELEIFDAHWRRPNACIEADPDLPYCQVLGRYQLTLNNFNARAPYANMNEKCPAVAPTYMRTPHDC